MSLHMLHIYHVFYTNKINYNGNINKCIPIKTYKTSLKNTMISGPLPLNFISMIPTILENLCEDQNCHRSELC